MNSTIRTIIEVCNYLSLGLFVLTTIGVDLTENNRKWRIAMATAVCAVEVVSICRLVIWILDGKNFSAQLFCCFVWLLELVLIVVKSEEDNKKKTSFE